MKGKKNAKGEVLFGWKRERGQGETETGEQEKTILINWEI